MVGRAGVAAIALFTLGSPQFDGVRPGPVDGPVKQFHVETKRLLADSAHAIRRYHTLNGWYRFDDVVSEMRHRVVRR